jgi:hypothetical protein
MVRLSQLHPVHSGFQALIKLLMCERTSCTS